MKSKMRKELLNLLSMMMPLNNYNNTPSNIHINFSRFLQSLRWEMLRRGLLSVGSLPQQAMRYYSTQSQSDHFDITVVGGGIVGLATAFRLAQKLPLKRILVVEKESQVGQHQSSHNSGVLHAGIYYQPGSDRAKLCVPGLQSMYQFLEEHNLPFDRCGKLIVAVDDEEIPALKALYQRAKKNACPNIRLITDPKEIRQIEPYCQGVAAIHSPETGVTDFKLVCDKLKQLLIERGVSVRCGFHAGDFTLDSMSLVTSFRNLNSGSRENISSSFLISCSGSESDRVAHQCGLSRFPAVIPVRGRWSIIKPVCFLEQ